MTRRLRVPPAPSTASDPWFRQWAQAVTDALNLLPQISASSGTATTSQVRIGQLNLLANASSVTTFAAPGVSLDAVLNVSPASRLSDNLIIAYSRMSAEAVAEVGFTASSVVTQSAFTLRWVGVST